MNNPAQQPVCPTCGKSRSKDIGLSYGTCGQETRKCLECGRIFYNGDLVFTKKKVTPYHLE
jgi:transposase-like protein